MERRHQSRSRTLKSARILLNHHQSVIDCVVRNLSPTGALDKFKVGEKEKGELLGVLGPMKPQIVEK